GGAAAAARLVAGRALGLAVVVVADMDDEVRVLGRGQARDLGERPPGLRVVAILDHLALQPAAGVAEDDDPLDARLGHGQRLAVDGGALRPRRQGRLADAVGEAVRRAGAQPHLLVASVDGQLWALRALGHGADLSA